MDQERRATIHRFGDCELDVARRELRRNGEIAAVEPQVFDFLRYLIENRNRLVTKDELNTEIWNGRIVSDAALSTAVKFARQAIGDSGKRQDYIRTVPRRGFRFVGTLEEADDGRGGDTTLESSASPLPARRPGRDWALPALIALAALLVAIAIEIWPQAPAEMPSIAVLPFQNFDQGPDEQLFADGISEDLITQLSKLSGLLVISRTSSSKYKGKSIDVRDIARDLDVRYVLEGSIRREGTVARINAQLIDADTAGHLWAETFEGAFDDAFALQDRINAHIVAALQIHLTPEEEDRLVDRGTKDLAAYDAYQRGERMRLHSKGQIYDEAVPEYEDAIRRDPSFAPAYAGLAHLTLGWATYGHHLGNTRELQNRALTLASRSLELGEQSLGRSALALYKLVVKYDHDGAEAEARRAISIDPSAPEALAVLGEVLLFAGKYDEAIAYLERAMRVDPGFPERYKFLIGQARFHKGELEATLLAMERFCEGATVRHYLFVCSFYRTSALSKLGRTLDAEDMVKPIYPQYDLASIETTIKLKFPFKSADAGERLLAGLRPILSR